MAFPINPVNGQTTTVNGVIYTYSNTLTAWSVTTNAGANISANNISAVLAVTGATVSASGNVTGGNILTGGLISVTANVTGGNILTGGLINSTGNATAGNIITSGIMSSTGNVQAGNLRTAGLISATGNIILSTNGFIGIGTATPDTELTILGNPQTVSYPVTGNSTTAGTELHITGADGANTRITQDALGTGSYVAFTGRSGRGTAATPTQTQSADILAQFTARGFSNGTLQFGNASTGALSIIAAENFTDTSRATNVQILTTAVSSITPTAIATFSSASGLSVAGNVTGGNILTGGAISATGNLTLAIITPTSSNVSIVGNVFPSANATYDLGSTSLRWKTVYTTDLELDNGIGNYTVVEGADDLFLYNNRSGKVFKFALIEVDPAIAPPKAKR
jgi:hypothetical protein